MDDKQKFIADLYPAAKNISKETGMSWELILAQAAQETGWGQRILDGTNNIFNIKASPDWQGQQKTFHVWEVQNGQKVWKDQSFRIYDSVEDALRDRVKFLRENPRYEKAGLFDKGTLGDLHNEAIALQKGSYATDPHYAQSIEKVFNGRTMQLGLAMAESQELIRESASLDLRERTNSPAVGKLQTRLYDFGDIDAHGCHSQSEPRDALEGGLSTNIASDDLTQTLHAALDKAPESDAITPALSSLAMEDVTQLQQYLQTIGMTDPRGQPLSVTGIQDDVTRMAVTMFQKEQGLPATGSPDPATCALAKAHAAIAELQRGAATRDISPKEVAQHESAVAPPPSIERTLVPDVTTYASRDERRTGDPSSMSAGHSLDDPRHEQSSHHALYDMLKMRIPEASEKRLLQFTAACHANQIHADNLDQIHFDRVNGRMSFTPSWPPGPTAVVDLKAEAPEPQQSMQHLQQVDHQQAQMMMDIRAPHAQQAPSQQVPMR